MSVARSQHILWLLIILVSACLILTRAQRLYSYFLSNISAFCLPDAWETGIFNTQPVGALNDRMKPVRARALRIDPNNVSAQVQEFRWLRAAGQLHDAAKLIPIVDSYKFFKFFPDYMWLKATYYSQADQWREAVSFYYLALSQTEASPPAAGRSDFYHALARVTLDSNSFDESLRYYKAGKFFLLAGESTRAVKQASRLLMMGSGASDAISWAYLTLAQDAYTSGQVDRAVDELGFAISAAKNPTAGAVLLSLARSSSDVALVDSTKAYLATLEPDWQLSSDTVACVQNAWELVGFDLDTDVLAAGLDVLLNLYWRPRCGETPESYALVDGGRYWIQPQYLVSNVFINAGFEWILPEGGTTVRSSRAGCCAVVALPGEDGHVLHIRGLQLPLTLAAEQPVARDLDNATYSYLVGGRIRWGEVNVVDDGVHAVIGGWWLDETDVRLPGFNTAVNLLQRFVVSRPRSHTYYGQGDWVREVAVVRAPGGAAKFYPWLGLSSGAKGSAQVYFDDLFLVPLFIPDDTAQTGSP